MDGIFFWGGEVAGWGRRGLGLDDYLAEYDRI